MSRVRSRARGRGVGGEPAGGHAGFTSGELADRLGAVLIGPRDVHVTRVDGLEAADGRTLTFIRSQRFADRWSGSGAAAALVSRGVEVPGHDASSRALLIVEDADIALARVLEMPAVARRRRRARVVDVHRRRHCATASNLGRVEAGRGAGRGVVLVAGVFIGRDAEIGAGSVLHPGAVVSERCLVGRRCVLHPGAVVGADGFGYRARPDGPGLVKIPHLGDVRLGDEVELGANTCVDRAKFGSTRIGEGTKIDNLVQMVTTARSSLVRICGQVGVSGR